MRIAFAYDLKKDAENFTRGCSSVNSNKPTKLQELYTREIGALDEAKVSAFLRAHQHDVPEKLKRIESGWRAVEPEMCVRMDVLFGVVLPTPPTAFLSTNSRCTYNISDNYFFVWMDFEFPNGIIAHELLHFYTWHAFHEELMQSGVTVMQYNDIKESLTEILNMDFADLLDGYRDRGYPQHREARARIRKRSAGERLARVVRDERNRLLGA